MPKIEVTVDVKVDGRRVRQFPYYFSTEVDEVYGDIEFELGSSPTVYSGVPHSALGEVVFGAYMPEGDSRWSLMLDQPFQVKKGGLLLLVNAFLDDGAATNVRVKQNTGANINVKAVAGGQS